MAIPEVDEATGYLPLGRHQCTLDELEQFCASGPHAEQRLWLLEHLRLYLRSVTKLFPGEHRFWIDGSFATHTGDREPFDVDVVTLLSKPELAPIELQIQEEERAEMDAAQSARPPKAPTKMRLLGLLTAQGVGSSNLPSARRVQPFGAHIDGFIAFEDETDALETWHRLWQGAETVGEEPYKGYLEVIA